CQRVGAYREEHRHYDREEHRAKHDPHSQLRCKLCKSELVWGTPFDQANTRCIKREGCQYAYRRRHPRSAEPQTDGHAFDELVRNPKRYAEDNTPGQYPRPQEPARPQEPVRWTHSAPFG